MLTLTRKVGEKIKIGDDIWIVVKEIRRNHCRLGIEAPKSLKIDRVETLESEAAARTGNRSLSALASNNAADPVYDEIIERVEARQQVRRTRSQRP